MGPASTAAHLQLPRSPLDVTIWAFISRGPSQGGSLGFDVPAAVKKLKFALHDPLEGGVVGGGWVGGGVWDVLHLASSETKSNLQSPSRLLLLCSEPRCAYVLPCQQCGSLGESHDPAGLFKQ